MSTPSTINQSTFYFLHYLDNNGTLAHFHSAQRLHTQVNTDFDQGPHESCLDHIDFLREEFADMFAKGQWKSLPIMVATSLSCCCILPSGIIPQCTVDNDELETAHQ